MVPQLFALLVAFSAASGDTAPAAATTPANKPTPALQPAKEGDDLRLADWDRADWQLVQTKTTLLDIKGYFRLRADLFRRLNLGNNTATEYVAGVPAPRYYATDGSNADYSGTNMRLRVEPTINVTEDIHIVSTFDILDNLILGSTPNAVFTTSQSPVNVLDRGTITMQRGANSVSDAIVVRRLYARVNAFSDQLELRVGRMPSEWGLGILSNAGNCLDCDFGDVVDRLAVSFKLADITFVPMYDWVSSGPVLSSFSNPGNALGRSGGQPIDAVPWDDVEQYSLRVMKLDLPDTIRERVSNGQAVINYGLWGIWRRQARDLNRSYFTTPNPLGTTQNTPYETDPSGGAPPQDRRDSSIYTIDGFAKAYVGGLDIGIEAAGIFGSFNLTEPGTSTGTTATAQNVSVYQLGAALEATYRAGGEAEGLTLSLKAGGASGDSAPGFGALDRTSTQFGRTSANEGYDNKLNNFQFSPDYHLDLIMFRQIIGTVTDAWYVRPELSYLFSNNVGTRLSTIYGQALFRRSTPSGSGRYRDPTGALQGARGQLPLGLEIDGEISYGLLGNIAEASPLKAAIAGGILFPFSGFKNPNPDVTIQDPDPSFAWTIQTRLYITF